MTDKIWTYEDITQAAEEQIARSMNLAAKARDEGDADGDSGHKRMAFGTYALWLVLTDRVRSAEDEARLSNLALSEKLHS